MEFNNKVENFEMVRKVVRELEQDSFTNFDIVKITGLNYSQVKKFLQTMIDIGELKYSETTKIYIKMVV